MEVYSSFWSHKHYAAVHDVFHVVQQSIANILVENLSLKKMTV